MSQNVWQKRQRQCDAPFLWSVKTINIGYSRSAKEHAQSLSPSSYWEVVQRCREFALVRIENCTLQMITRGAVKEKPWHLISVSSMETRSFLILWIGTGQTQCRNTLHKKSRNNHDRLPSEHYHYPSSTKDAKKNMRRFELNPNKIFVDDWMTFSLAHMWYFHVLSSPKGTPRYFGLDLRRIYHPCPIGFHARRKRSLPLCTVAVKPLSCETHMVRNKTSTNSCCWTFSEVKTGEKSENLAFRVFKQGPVLEVSAHTYLKAHQVSSLCLFMPNCNDVLLRAASILKFRQGFHCVAQLKNARIFQ